MNKLTTTLVQTKSQIGHLLKSNSPAILTALGVSGTITTAYLTGKAAYESAGVIRNHENRGNQRPDAPIDRIKEQAPLVWKLYLPAAVSGTLTVVCILAAAKSSAKRTAAVTAAYSLSERALTEYRDKVTEVIGERKEQAIRDQIAQDRVTDNPPTQGQLVLSVPGNVLCFDSISGRYFHSDMEALRKAENKINAKIIRDLYVPLNEFYYLVGLDPTHHGDEIGWDSDKGLMELYFSPVLSKENVPCISIDYSYTKPI